MVSALSFGGKFPFSVFDLDLVILNNPSPPRRLRGYMLCMNPASTQQYFPTLDIITGTLPIYTPLTLKDKSGGF